MIGALEVSLYLVNRARDQWKNHQPIIVFLTDGEPTDGVNNPDQITDIVSISSFYLLYIRDKDIDKITLLSARVIKQIFSGIENGKQCAIIEFEIKIIHTSFVL